MSEKQTRTTDIGELHNETAIKEVQSLLKSGITDITPDIVNKLRSKYSDDNVVDSIMEYFVTRRNTITKVANVFVEAFERKYKNEFQSMSLSKFMKRALKYKKKYNLTDDEFDEIRRVFEIKVYNTQPNIASLRGVVYPNTTLSRTLGFPLTESTDSIKPSNTDEYSHLQDILRMYQMFKAVHSYVVIQTMSYQDLSVEAMSGTYEKKFNYMQHIHPVIVALYGPKIKSLEERMLYANIAGIINTRYNKERVVTKPDYELFYAMIVDPADTICDPSSPMKDLKSRVEVQVQLWNNVYNLRLGKYYEATVMDFLAYLDKCKVTNVDNPEAIYLSDEGTILRRLFSIFAYRPIIVSTMPVISSIHGNPLNIPTVTPLINSIPYITYRLPNMPLEGMKSPAIFGGQPITQEILLSSAINQVQFYFENGVFVPKSTQILDVRGPLVFYVPRRQLRMPVLMKPELGPLSIGQLASSTRHYQSINDIPLKDLEITMPVDTYEHKRKECKLRSVVAFKMKDNIIMGHTTSLFKMDSVDPTTADYLYDPTAPVNSTSTFAAKIDPMQINVSVGDDLKKYGTIFVYNFEEPSV